MARILSLILSLGILAVTLVVLAPDQSTMLVRAEPLAMALSPSPTDAPGRP